MDAYNNSTENKYANIKTTVKLLVRFFLMGEIPLLATTIGHSIETLSNRIENKIKKQKFYPADAY